MAITTGTANAATAAKIVITAAIRPMLTRPMLTRPATASSLCRCPAGGDWGAAAG